MFLTIAFDVILAALILYRQRRIRPVPRTLHLRLPIFLGVLGLIEILDYTGGHQVTAGGLWLLIGVTVVGAGVLGFIRALTVTIWESNHWVVRQGTWLTMGLWVLSLAVHLTSAFGAAQVGSGGLESSSLLLYLALTLGVQAYVVHVRAAPMWRALGPEAGQPFRINFGAGPGGPGSFFAGFGDFGGAGGPFGNSPERNPHANDPTVIDVEVVDDDDPPAALGRP
jgi:hypothetical protein